MAGRRSKGEGSITYDSRRKRFRAKVTIGWELNEETGRSKQITKDIGSNFKTRGEAAKALADYLARPYDLDNKNITFAELYKIWSEDFLKENESYKYRVPAAYRYCSDIYDKKMREITVLDMKNCINKGKVLETKGKNKGQYKTATPQTKESIKFVFNHMMAYAVEARLVDRNYAKDFTLDKKVFQEKEKNRKIKIPFSKEELTKLWKSIDFVPFADMVVYACYSGWRPSELVKIRTADVDLETGFIRGGIKSTAGKNRLVPIHSLIRPIVEKYYKEATELHSDYLFNDSTVKKGIGLTYNQYLTRFGNVLLAVGLRKDITPHYTRHTFVTKAKSKEVKMDEYLLKMIVGHKIGDLTEYVYTHRELQELKEEIELIKE